MQPQPQRLESTRHVVPTSRRREVRNNVIYWREQAIANRTPPQLPPGEDGSKPLVAPWVQNVFLIVVGVAALLIAAKAGVL